MRQFDLLDKIVSSNLPVFVIPCGLRCYTRPVLRKKGITGKSGPFDNGFFPPNVISPMLMDENIVYNSDTIKYAMANPTAPEIKFKTSSRDMINELIQTGPMRVTDDGFELIDGSGGYYIYTAEYNSVLCHWLTYDATDAKHILSQTRLLQSTIRRRLARINDICKDDAVFKLFVYRDPNGFTGYSLDDHRIDTSPTSVEFDMLARNLKQMYKNVGLVCFHKLADTPHINKHYEMYGDDSWSDFVSQTKQRLNIKL